MKVTGYFLDPVTFIITFPSITYQKHVNLPFSRFKQLSQNQHFPKVTGVPEPLVTFIIY